MQGNAKLLQSTYSGYGSEKFEVSYYEYVLNGRKHTETRTKNTCIPISGRMEVTNGFSDYAFFGWTEHIKDTSALDLPRECLRNHTSVSNHTLVSKCCMVFVLFLVCLIDKYEHKLKIVEKENY